MKANRRSIRAARRLYRLCLIDGRLTDIAGGQQFDLPLQIALRVGEHHALRLDLRHLRRDVRLSDFDICRLSCMVRLVDLSRLM